MKKTILLLLALCFTSMMFADNFVMVKVKDQQNLRELFNKQDLNIHYYNDNFVLATTQDLNDNMIYPVMENAFPAKLFPVTFVPEKTLQKLRNGEKVRLLAWGDSVTECSYLPKKCRWQEQFRQRLQKIYPQADIELLTEAWGGHSTSSFLDAPAGHEHNFCEKILAVKPDLIISEFVNDCNLPEETFSENYCKIKEAFDQIDAEWIILTPHYTSPDRMNFPNSKKCDDDPRLLVKFLRNFAVKNQIPLADASIYWGRLYRQGIPYETLFCNGINHPLEYGLSLFADALMNLFQ